MRNQDKACPVVTRVHGRAFEVLAFVHPLAGKQFVKGSIEPGQTPDLAAIRELREESGLVMSAPTYLGNTEIGEEHQSWHFFHRSMNDLPNGWDWQTEDDEGHMFRFFWHLLGAPLDTSWHPIFHEAYGYFAPLIGRRGE